MAAMRFVGNGHSLPPHVRVHEDGSSYVIELHLANFTADELAVDTLGQVVTVRGEQHESAADRHLPFRLHERLVERFRLPDDASRDRITASYKHGTLELRVDRVQLGPRRVQNATDDVRHVHADAAPI